MDGIKTCLFVDFDNVFIYLREQHGWQAAEHFAVRPKRWLSWFEAGAHLRQPGKDGDSSLKSELNTAPACSLLIRRCYINPSFSTYRKNFTYSGFRPIDCPSLTSQGKNAADISMALDIVDLLNHPSQFEQFIILSADADFTPVLLRLREYGRSGVVLATQSTSSALKASSTFLIDSSRFIEEALGLDPAASAPPADSQTRQPAKPVRQPDRGGQALTPPLRIAKTSATPSPSHPDSSDESVSTGDGTATALLADIEQVATRLVSDIRERGEPLPVKDFLSHIRHLYPQSKGNANWLGFTDISHFLSALTNAAPELEVSGALGADVLSVKAPATTTPEPTATTPAPVATTSEPTATTPAPVATTPAPAATTPAPAVTTPAPVATTPAPVATTPAPVATTPAPAVTTPAPAATTSKPAPTRQKPAPSGRDQSLGAKLKPPRWVADPRDERAYLAVADSLDAEAPSSTGQADGRSDSAGRIADPQEEMTHIARMLIAHIREQKPIPVHALGRHLLILYPPYGNSHDWLGHGSFQQFLQALTDAMPELEVSGPSARNSVLSVKAPAATTPEPAAATPAEPAATTTPQPVAATPEPAATTPQPAATTPQPVATTPEPAAAATPQPAAAATPQPAAAATPQPAAIKQQPESISETPNATDDLGDEQAALNELVNLLASAGWPRLVPGQYALLIPEIAQQLSSGNTRRSQLSDAVQNALARRITAGETSKLLAVSRESLDFLLAGLIYQGGARLGENCGDEFSVRQHLRRALSTMLKKRGRDPKEHEHLLDLLIGFAD